MIVSGPSCLNLVELGRFSWGGLSNNLIFASIFGLLAGFELWLGMVIFQEFPCF